MSGRRDPVSPEDATYVLRRDPACVVAILSATGRIPSFGPCRGLWGGPPLVPTDWTVAHVRDRGKGGRSSKRPPSTPRHLVKACVGHHLADPVVDRPEVRDALDEYLELREGPDQDEGNRPHEAIARVRSARHREEGILPTPDGSDRPGSEEGRDDGTR